MQICISWNRLKSQWICFLSYVNWNIWNCTRKETLTDLRGSSHKIVSDRQTTTKPLQYDAIWLPYCMAHYVFVSTMLDLVEIFYPVLNETLHYTNTTFFWEFDSWITSTFCHKNEKDTTSKLIMTGQLFQLRLSKINNHFLDCIWQPLLVRVTLSKTLWHRHFTFLTHLNLACQGDVWQSWEDVEGWQFLFHGSDSRGEKVLNANSNWWSSQFGFLLLEPPVPKLMHITFYRPNGTYYILLRDSSLMFIQSHCYGMPWIKPFLDKETSLGYICVCVCDRDSGIWWAGEG